MTPAARPKAFFLYRDSALRREALGPDPTPGVRYSLYGLDGIAAAGFDVSHNLEPGTQPGRGARAVARVLNRTLQIAGGYGGDFASVLASRKRLNRADVVFSTVDTVGIPLALLGAAGVLRPPIVYAAIGLPERFERLRGRAVHRLYQRAYRRLHTVVAYGWGEVEALRAWLGADAPEVVFVPFGVDTTAFAPHQSRSPEADVVSVGADPHRDYGLLVDLARRQHGWSFRVVSSRDHADALAELPANVGIELDVPFATARDRMAEARIVVLPVRDNSYSGATTVLLQAMAMAKPVVVTRTAAIARGYHLEDGLNCRLVPPGDLEAMDRAVSDLLADGENAAAIGRRARETVERHLGWDRYAGAIAELLVAATSVSTVRA